MRKSPGSPLAESAPYLPESAQYLTGPGGEGGSIFRTVLAAPSQLTEALTPKALLTISLLLSALLVGLAATALTT